MAKELHRFFGLQPANGSFLGLCLSLSLSLSLGLNGLHFVMTLCGLPPLKCCHKTTTTATTIYVYAYEQYVKFGNI